MSRISCIRSAFLILTVSFLGACGSDFRPGAAGGSFNTPDNIPAPVVVNPITPTPVPSGSILMFATYEIYSGDFAKFAPSDSIEHARDGADILCQENAVPAARGKKIHAFVGISINDRIVDMPTKFNFSKDLTIFGDKGLKIANNWSDLLDGKIDSTLHDALENMISDSFYWTGSAPDGATVVDDNCNDWSTDQNNATGLSGFSEHSDEMWLDSKSDGCGIGQQIICVAY